METADPILEFFVWWTYEDDNFSFNLQTFLSLLPLAGVAFLDVKTDFNVYLSSELWRVAFGSTQTLKQVHLNTGTSNFWKALVPEKNDNRPTECLPFSALTSVTVDDHLLDSQLILDNLRVRSTLGGAQLQDLFISREEEDNALPAPVLTQLGELVPHVQVTVNNGGSDLDDVSLDSENDEF